MLHFYGSQGHLWLAYQQYLVRVPAYPLPCAGSGTCWVPLLVGCFLFLVAREFAQQSEYFSLSLVCWKRSRKKDVEANSYGQLKVAVELRSQISVQVPFSWGCSQRSGLLFASCFHFLLLLCPYAGTSVYITAEWAWIGSGSVCTADFFSPVKCRLDFLVQWCSGTTRGKGANCHFLFTAEMFYLHDLYYCGTVELAVSNFTER